MDFDFDMDTNASEELAFQLQRDDFVPAGVVRCHRAETLLRGERVA